MPMFKKNGTTKSFAFDKAWPHGTIRNAFTNSRAWIGPIDQIWIQDIVTRNGSARYPNLCIKAPTAFTAPKGLPADAAPKNDYCVIARNNEKRMELRLDGDILKRDIRNDPNSYAELLISKATAKIGIEMDQGIWQPVSQNTPRLTEPEAVAVAAFLPPSTSKSSQPASTVPTPKPQPSATAGPSPPPKSLPLTSPPAPPPEQQPLTEQPKEVPRRRWTPAKRSLDEPEPPTQPTNAPPPATPIPIGGPPSKMPRPPPERPPTAQGNWRRLCQSMGLSKPPPPAPPLAVQREMAAKAKAKAEQEKRKKLEQQARDTMSSQTLTRNEEMFTIIADKSYQPEEEFENNADKGAILRATVELVAETKASMQSQMQNQMRVTTAPFMPPLAPIGLQPQIEATDEPIQRIDTSNMPTHVEQLAQRATAKNVLPQFKRVMTKTRQNNLRRQPPQLRQQQHQRKDPWHEPGPHASTQWSSSEQQHRQHLPS